MEHTNELKFDEITSLTTQLKEDVLTLKTKIEEYEKAITRIKGKLTVTTAFFLTSVWWDPLLLAYNKQENVQERPKPRNKAFARHRKWI